MSTSAPAGFRPLSEEQPIDVSRSVAALRRGGWLIVLIVVPITATVLALSLVLPKTYSATTALVVDEGGAALTSTDAASATRRLATMRALLTSRDVLTNAAGTLPGESLKSLKDKVSASVDDLADLIKVKAVDSDARGAAAIANRVAAAFIERRRTAGRERYAQAGRDLRLALQRAQSTPGSGAEVTALRQRLSDLSVSEVAAGDELQIAEAAQPPTGPDSPRPLQNTLFALCASLFLAVLAALARDRLAPRVAGPAELTALTGLTPLVMLPKARGRRRVAQVSEAYEALAASLRVQLGDSQRIVLVTSAHQGENRSAVTVGLGRALAVSDKATLLVSADLRGPGLHKALGVPRAPGLANVLEALERDDAGSAAGLVRSATRAGEHPSRGELRGLPSGDPSQHPAALLSGDALGLMFDELRRSEYRYVIVDGPPLLGPIDGQLVARWAEAVLVVCELDKLAPGEAAELGDVLARLDAPILGSIVIGGGRVRYSLPAWTPMRAAPVPPER